MPGGGKKRQKTDRPTSDEEEEAKKQKLADEDAPKRRTRSTQPPKEEADDDDDEQTEEKPEKKSYPARFTEKGLWRIHNAVFRDIVITPSEVGLPLCRWCRRPIRSDLIRHQLRCWWCSTCQDFVTTDVSKHICSLPGPDTIACPICGRMLEGKNYLRHLNNVHKDIDTTQYRRRSESARERDQRLKKEGKAKGEKLRPADIKTARAIVQKPFKEETKTGVKAEVKEEVQEEKPKHSRRRRSNRKQTSSSTTASDSGLATSPHSSPSDSRLESPEYESTDMAVYDEDNSSATDPAGKSLPEFPPVVIIDNQAIALIPIPEVEEASDEGKVMSDVEDNEVEEVQDVEEVARYVATSILDEILSRVVEDTDIEEVEVEGSLENDTTESTEIATSILDEILDRVQSHVQEAADYDTEDANGEQPDDDEQPKTPEQEEGPPAQEDDQPPENKQGLPAQGDKQAQEDDQPQEDKQQENVEIEADVESDVPVAEIQAVEDEPQQEEQIEKSDLEHVQDDQEGHEIHQGDAPEEKEQVPHLDLLQQVLSQSDLDMDMDQPTSDVDMDEGASVIEQSPKQAASQQPHVILSPEQFRIRDAEDEEEHNEEPGISVQVDYSKMAPEDRDKLVTEVGLKLLSNVCLFCCKEFPTKTALENHFWDHTDDRFQLECLICGASYISKDALMQHISDHNKRENLPPPSPTKPVFKLKITPTKDLTADPQPSSSGFVQPTGPKPTSDAEQQLQEVLQNSDTSSTSSEPLVVDLCTSEEEDDSESNVNLTVDEQPDELEYEEDLFPNVEWCITAPVNYQPRIPPILNEYEKNIVLCLLNDMKERIIYSMRFMISDNLVDLLPAFCAFKLGMIPTFIFNFIYEQLRRETETVRDRFFRVLWIATLIWKLSEYPLPDHVQQLDYFIQEAKNMNPDGTQKTPKKRKASTSQEKIKIQIKKSKK